ncbi:MAG: rod shape-determining protein MreD [Lachnospiraceae bacterium]|nr:rod shape-determining protein MreD [Lachnospiraceae bacterium]
MLRKILTVLLVLFCFILQSTVFGAISLGGVVPNIMMIITSSFGFMRGEKEGIVIGFFCGMLADIFFGDFLGLYALIFMYIGFLNGKFSRIFYPQDLKLPLALIITSDLTYGMLYYVLFFMLRGRFDFSFYFLNVILPEAVYTIFMTIFVYPVILLINERLEDRERRSEQKFV